MAKIDVLHENMNNEYMKGKGTLRIGQCYMNVLYDIDPTLYREITGTQVDPFYVDDRIEAFLRFCEEHWNA